MSPQTGPFAYTATVDELAASLGVARARLQRVSDLIEAGSGYHYRGFRRYGKTRVIAIPFPEVKLIQQRIADFLYPLHENLHSACMAYVPGRSAVSNAAPHCGATWVQRLDIQDFYPRTTARKIERALLQWGATPDLAKAISALTVDDGLLPLGSPSSPMLSNLILHPVDIEMAAAAGPAGLAYTRYADDFTFSGTDRFDMTVRLSDALRPLGYRLNPAKSKIRKRGQAIVVTGLRIEESDRPRLPKFFKRRLRQELHYIEAYGLEQHCLRTYFWWFIDEDNEEAQLKHSIKHVRGKLLYARGVEPDWAEQLLTKYPIAKNLLVPPRRTLEQRATYFRKVANQIRRENIQLPRDEWLEYFES